MSKTILKKIVEMSGLSFRELAQRTGVSELKVLLLMYGIVPYTDRTAKRFAFVLNIPNSLVLEVFDIGGRK